MITRFLLTSWVAPLLLAVSPGFAQEAGSPAFAPTAENKMLPPGPAPVGMVWIPGGEFSMGSDGKCDGKSCCSPDAVADAQPIHRVRVDGFWMDETDVTNAEFEKFVMATGYITVAERTPTKEEFPDAPPESLVAGSAVFTPPPGPVPLNDHLQWWSYVKGANWRHPEGPQSNIKGKESCPVVQVAYEDARAYAKCACKRLPTEAEWEFAARGGLAGKTYAWGDEKDGFAGIAPVKSFPPNGYGVHDMAGNVWQWCGDWTFRSSLQPAKSHATRRVRKVRSIRPNPESPSPASYETNTWHLHRRSADGHPGNLAALRRFSFPNFCAHAPKCENRT